MLRKPSTVGSVREVPRIELLALSSLAAPTIVPAFHSLVSQLCHSYIANILSHLYMISRIFLQVRCSTEERNGFSLTFQRDDSFSACGRAL